MNIMDIIAIITIGVIVYNVYKWYEKTWYKSYCITTSKNTTHEKEEEYNIFYDNIEYFAGYEDIGYSKCFIKTFDDKIQLQMKSNGYQTKDIYYDDIETIKPISTTEIKEIPSLAKLILLGKWGLLGKGKEKLVAVDYISIMGKNDKFNIILKAENRGIFISSIKGSIGRWEYNNQRCKEQ